MSNYGASPGFDVLPGGDVAQKKRKSFKVWLRDKLNSSIDRSRKIEKIYPAESVVQPLDPYKFNNNFEGWHIRLHKAHDGHVVEAWRTEEIYNRNSIGQSQQHHILFTVKSSEDMATSLNDILVQLALRM